MTISVVSSTINVFVMTYDKFQNPSSTSALTGISVTLVNGVTVVESNTNAALTSLTPALMTTTPTLASSSDVVGATGATLTVSFTTLNELPSNG